MNAVNKKILRDIILIASLILIAVVVPLIVNSQKTDGGAVEVRVNGSVYGVYSLKDDIVVDIDGKCKLQIEGGAARIAESTCRKHICVAHSPIKYGGETIVCLPNGVSVRVLGDEYDFVS